MDRKKIQLFALLAALTCLASGCGKDEEKEEPHTLREYALGSETVVALQPEEEDVQGVKDLTQVYRYSGLENAGATVSSYVEQLTDSENGFSVVDENFVRTDKPDFTQDAGTVRLARKLEIEEEETAQTEDKEEDKDDEEEKEKKEDKEEEKDEESKDSEEKDDKKEKDEQKDQAEEENKDQKESDADPEQKDEKEEEQQAAPKKWLVTVQIDWRDGNCVVTVDQKEGSITSPKKKAKSGASAAKSLSQTEGVDYLKTLSPAALGLEGASMDAYQVQSQDGVVMVDNQPCMKLRVYNSQTPEGTNEIMGNYLMTRDGEHIYQLDESTRTVREVQIPK